MGWSLASSWQKNDPKNDVKDDREHPGNKNEAKMHFTWSSALGTFKLHLKGLGEKLGLFTVNIFGPFLAHFHLLGRRMIRMDRKMK
jgi:hypothetical protein